MLYTPAIKIIKFRKKTMPAPAIKIIKIKKQNYGSCIIASFCNLKLVHTMYLSYITYFSRNAVSVKNLITNL